MSRMPHTRFSIHDLQFSTRQSTRLLFQNDPKLVNRILRLEDSTLQKEWVITQSFILRSLRFERLTVDARGTAGYLFENAVK